MRPLLPTLALLIGACVAAPANAQRTAPEAPAPFDAFSESIQELFNSAWHPKSRFTNSPATRAAFRSVVAEARESVVEIRKRGKRVALGGVVGPDGWIVTKATLIRMPVTCRLKDGRELDARLVGVDSETDLAMLKIEAKGLTPMKLRSTPEAEGFVALKTDDAVEASADAIEPSASIVTPMALQPGDWVATVGVGRDPVAVGVLSVLPREIAKRPGFLGVAMDRNYIPPANVAPKVRISEVIEDSAASEAGLAAGDFIVSVDATRTPTSNDLIAAISVRNPGDRVRLVVQRGEETLRMVVILRGKAPNPGERRSFYQNNLGSDLSERRFGFPFALQHDTVLDRNDCGGPIVDLDGRVVGLNISRAGRTESYALPVSEVERKLVDLMSGRLAPAGAE